MAYVCIPTGTTNNIPSSSKAGAMGYVAIPTGTAAPYVFPTGMVIQFEAGVADTLSGGLVTAAVNQASGSSAGNLTFAVGKRPTSRANSINGHIGWTTDSTTVGVGTTQPFTAGGPMTVFGVIRPRPDPGSGANDAGCCVLCTRGNNGTADNQAVLLRSSGLMYVWRGNATLAQGAAADTYVYDQPMIVSWNADVGVSTTPNVWINAGVVNSVGPSGTAATDTGALAFSIGGGSLGGGAGAGGDIVEVVAWNRTLSAAELASVNAHYSIKYQIPVQLQTTV